MKSSLKEKTKVSGSLPVKSRNNTLRLANYSSIKYSKEKELLDVVDLKGKLVYFAIFGGKLMFIILF
jgi:hypothetical protein